MLKSNFSFDLPQDLIAQTPIEPRDHSRLMVVSRENGGIEHRHFYDLPNILHADDLLVVNDSKVLPARLYGEKETTGAAVELLLLEHKEKDIWEALVRPGKKLKEGTSVIFGNGRLRAENVQHLENARCLCLTILLLNCRTKIDIRLCMRENLVLQLLPPPGFTLPKSC